MRHLAMISLHTCPLAHPGVAEAGGMNVFVLHLAKALVELGWSVDIFTHQHRGREEKIAYRKGGLRVIHFKVGSSSSLSKEALLNCIDDFSEQIVRFWEKEKNYPQLLYAHYYLSGLVARTVGQKTHIPFISTFHTLGVMKRIYGHENSSLRIKLEKEVARSARLIVATTLLEKKALTKFYGVGQKKIVVVPAGVDARLFCPRSKKVARRRLNFPKEKKLILFVGRLDPIKGLLRLMRVIEKLSIAHQEFTRKFQILLIGGNTRASRFWRLPEVVKIRQFILKHNLDCCVKFLGFRPHGQLVWYYSAADVVVLPSFYESFGLVALEAMSCGAAVLAARVGGLRFLIKDGKNGLLFANDHPRQLLEKLWRLLQDAPLRKKLGQEAAHSVRMYSWAKSARLLTESLSFLGKQ